MRIEHRQTVAGADILTRQILQQRGLSGSGFSNDVRVRPAIGLPDAENLPVIPEVGLADDGDWIGILHASMKRDSPQSRHAAFPASVSTLTPRQVPAHVQFGGNPYADGCSLTTQFQQRRK